MPTMILEDKYICLILTIEIIALPVVIALIVLILRQSENGHGCSDKLSNKVKLN